MNAPPDIVAARNFLEVALGSGAASLDRLAHVLDELASAYHVTPSGEPAVGEKGPNDKEEYHSLYRRIGEHFPSLGYYAASSGGEELSEPPTVGDAIDDLVDIARDLSEVLWRFEFVGADDAHWHYRFLFEVHWGRHLRDLSLYLHVKQFEVRNS